MTWTRTAAVLATAAALLCLGAVSAAAAGNPDRQPLPTPGDLTISCAQGFDLTAHVVLNQEYLLSFTERDGTSRLQVNGDLVATFSGNGQTVVLNISGPATYTFTADGTLISLVDRGRGVVIAPDLSDMWLIVGRSTLDADGNVTEVDGTRTDLCALLAS